MKNLKLSILTLGMLLLSSGCGSSNNDQGAGFTLLQFNFIDEQNVVQCDQGITQTLLNVSSIGAGALTGDVIGIDFVNNLVGQTIRIERANIEYFVAGTDVKIPNGTSAIGQVLPPRTNTGTSLPEQDSTTPDCASFYIVPPAITAWIDQNRNLLPEMPFVMEARVTGVGVTSAGRVLESNPLNINITVVSDVIIPGTPPPDGLTPPGGAEGGAGSGSGALESGVDTGTSTSSDGLLQ